mmetsp:Transcript_12399/g.14673  ORF Transcript_12399/g.14673 Transcript_12399/m.14673 type:complete len:90 (+) Transcript_12399:324-593(+)|eukprot:jgi/Bigna1/65097/fgenesh1_kg.97_\
MDSISKQIEKLREKENKLNEQLGNKDQLVLKGIIDKGEYGREKSSLRAQTAETQEEIKVKEAELKEIIKKFVEATGNVFLLTPEEQSVC